MLHRWLIDPVRGIAVGRPAGVVGILNVTPDSFSDGGRYTTCDAAVQAAMAMVREGADWLDIGGESTRPGAAPVPAEAETARVVPMLAALRAAGVRMPISIDTMKGAVAVQALAAGCDVVNDVSGGRDPHLLEVVASARCPLVLMHMRGDPQTMQVGPSYDDVVAEVESGLERCLRRAVAAGVRESAIVLDPGIGFGKTVAHNLALLAALPRFEAAFGRPLLVGVSRKSLLAAVTGMDGAAAGRDAASHAMHALLAGTCALLRVHDVAGARAAVRISSRLQEAA
jgi:dihydropteroate synthase